MGVTLMENFNLGVTAAADIAPALAVKGWVLPVPAAVSYALVNDTENGVTRPVLRQNYNYSAGLGTGFRWMAIKIPIPASKSFYFSARIRWPSGGAPTAGMRFFMGTANSSAVANNFAVIAPQAAGSTKWNMYAGYNLANPFYSFLSNTWTCVEIYRAPDGSVKLWLDDMLLVYPQTVAAPADNFIYFGQGSTDNVGAIYAWDIADVVVVDPATDGLKYRPGAKHRVVSASFSADDVAEWAAPSSPHYSVVSGLPITPGAANILTGDTVGQREKYSGITMANPQPTFDKVLSVMLEQRLNNLGGVSHSLYNEVDVGAGNEAVATQDLAPAVGWQYRPVFLDKKPDGTNWSMSDVLSMKAGYSIKS